MLNGIDPVIIIQLSVLEPSFETKQLIDNVIPLVSSTRTFFEQPPIPIYLSEKLTGLFIDDEEKDVSIDTDVQTTTQGTDPNVQQKGLFSTVTVNLKAKKDSPGLILLSALVDLIFKKATSKEYKISYLHGATTIFGALLHDYSASQNANDDLLRIKIQLSSGNAPTPPANVPTLFPTPGAQVLP